MTNVFTRKCPHNVILGPLQHCARCLESQRAAALAKAGSQRPPFDIAALREELREYNTGRIGNCACHIRPPCAACSYFWEYLPTIAEQYRTTLDVVTGVAEELAFGGEHA